MLAHP